ncbi:MAG: thioredoxin family protein [Saprospiraceae bacterium]|nr:thioredoxin family protein [Saprospiraceae bacterium]
MIRQLLFVFGLLFFAAGNTNAQGIDFFHGTWPEALAKAKAENKIIFVDAYAAWCGPCKRMAAQVFPDPKVGDFFNQNFINLKIDMEKPENKEFAGKYPVRAYPTLMFIDAEGKIVLQNVGGMQIDGLIEFGKKAAGSGDKSVDFEAEYANGNRDPQFLYDYVKALNRANKPSLKITNEYLNTQSDLTTPFNLKFILEGASEADSRVFDLLLKYRKEINAVEKPETVDKRIEQACNNTLKKAIEFKNEELLNEAKSKMKAAIPARADAYENEADMKYYAVTKDSGKYLKAAQRYQKSEVKNNAAKLNDLVIVMCKTFPEDKKVLDQAEKWAKIAAENGGLPDYYMTLAEVYKRKGDKDKARQAADQALKAIGENDTSGMRPKIDYFKQSLEGI